MNAKQKDHSSQAIDEPIICSAYEEPTEHWSRDRMTRIATREKFRRPAGYWYKTEESKTGAAQGDLIAEDRQDLPIVNRLREDVRNWREGGYPNASHITKHLLAHWTNSARPRRLFFCQREAVETIIYLAEVRIPKQPQSVGGHKCVLSASDLKKLLAGESLQAKTDGSYTQSLLDQPEDQALPGLVRFGCKMATGSGKTLVMAMLIAWALCNRSSGSSTLEFPRAILVCCPNLTVKRRLDVLRPGGEDNYYDKFDLIPPGYPSLPRGRVLVINWHAMLPASSHREGNATYDVINKGTESSEAFARRLLGDLFERLPIMVLNDEGHHCWRPKLPCLNDMSHEEKEKFKEEQREATVWMDGLDKINSVAASNSHNGIAFCVDMSATPFYIRGSGYQEGWPFPWLVSDFGLVDAIESGIVKIPRIPIQDTTGQPEPRYFRLWQHIMKELRLPEDKEDAPYKDAKKIYEKADAALKQIAGQWLERFEYSQNTKEGQDKTSPVLIVVCSDTNIAKEFFEKISGERVIEGKTVYGQSEVFDQFTNTQDRKYTIRIDSNALDEAGTGADKQLRDIVATVGKAGQPGEHIRCVVSVSMLTEGWDANNVTQILGVRAFKSQLLCEQVVGRGLRRMDCVPDPDTGLLTAEYVDVYGIPFSVVPYKGRVPDAKQPEDKPLYHVFAMKEREDMEMFFPLINGYLFNLEKNLVRCNFDQLSTFTISRTAEPEATVVQPPLDDGGPRPINTPLSTERQSRQKYYEKTHINTIMFLLAREIVDELISYSIQDNKKEEWGELSRPLLYPQVYAIVKEYVSSKIDFNGMNACELGIKRNFNSVRKNLLEAIVPDEYKGETPLLPHFILGRRIGTTQDVNFKTSQECHVTKYSHINLVTLDSGWEGSASAMLEQAADDGLIHHYARINRNTGFTIPCGTMGNGDYSYIPDFLVRMANPKGDPWTLILEIKGLETEKDRIKHSAAHKWVAAVNNWGELGQWGFHVCYDPNKLSRELKKLYKNGPDTRPNQTA